MDEHTKNQFQSVRAWVDAKIATHAEPPSSWFRLMKLREDLDAVLAAEASYIRLAAKDGAEVMPEVIPVNLP